MPTVLILYYSRTGGTRLLAEKIAYGALLRVPLCTINGLRALVIFMC